ncbi:MAG: sigma-70 family RNA polymerase sigma factor [Holophagales bacterium]|nr:MAG: sigma-70 family RNA polymerase sigma factor [Holophagales bacterium]
MSGEITRWLGALRAGDRGALDRLVPLLYDELRGLARRLLGQERAGHTLTPTSLVHEAYLRLLKERRIGAEDRGEFFAVAATAMRRILIESARRRSRAKRGGAAERVSLEAPEAIDAWLTEAEAEELLAIDEALADLEALNPRLRQVVEMRVFVGLSVEESAAALAVNEKTVRRDWQLARAWLRRRIGGELGAAAD